MDRQARVTTSRTGERHRRNRDDDAAGQPDSSRPQPLAPGGQRAASADGLSPQLIAATARSNNSSIDETRPSLTSIACPAEQLTLAISQSRMSGDRGEDREHWASYGE